MDEVWIIILPLIVFNLLVFGFAIFIMVLNIKLARRGIKVLDIFFKENERSDEA